MNLPHTSLFAEFWLAFKYDCRSNNTVTRGFDSRTSSTWVILTEEVSVPLYSAFDINVAEVDERPIRN
jgi:hypothetical protein